MNKENGAKNKNLENLKCIWMASQVIEYKLCDNQFDCENCLFDKVMRNLLDKKETNSDSGNNAADKILTKLQSIQFDDKIMYLKNNLIAKEICYNTFYLSINPILHSFLDSVSSVFVNNNRKVVSAGQKLIQISGAWGEFSLSAPMDFLIYDKSSDLIDNLMKSRWLAIIGIDNLQLSKGRMFYDEWNEMYTKAINVVEDIKSEIPKVGKTMLDGGTEVRYLYQLIGSKKYIELLNGFLF